jgi:hypothetical protein
MKRLTMAMCCACLMATAGSAQTSMDKDKMAKDKMSKPTVVTGCVAAGSEAGHYMLTNGMMAGDTMGKSYNLMGGDLKAHVGHKVEVTGTMDSDKMMGKDAMKKDAMKKDTMAKDTMAKDKMAMSEMHDALQVKSVKMISSTCP